MEIRTLRYFLAVAREENMTKAAEQLHVTQPTLSKALKALEEELGKKLFTRHSFSIRLTEKKVIAVDDLIGLPLFCSEQSWKNDIPTWCGERIQELQLEGSFRLSYNASMFAKENLGYLLTLDRLVDTSPDSGLVFRPLTPPLITKLYLIWKKYQVFSPIAERFLEHIKQHFKSIN